jgi:hypothetical protein
MRAHWRKIAYAALWISLLAITFESFVHPEADNETRAVMMAIVALFAAPISVVLLCVVSAIGWLFSTADGATMGFVTDNRFAQFLLYGLLMFVASYWQWFHLLPRLKSKLRGTPDT